MIYLYVKIRNDYLVKQHAGNKAIIEIDTARCIKGALPSRQRLNDFDAIEEN